MYNIKLFKFNLKTVILTETTLIHETNLEPPITDWRFSVRDAFECVDGTSTGSLKSVTAYHAMLDGGRWEWCVLGVSQGEQLKK